MTQNEIKNASELVYGYFIPRLNEVSEVSFDRAKKETIKKLKSRIDSIKELSFDQFRRMKYD